MKSAFLLSRTDDMYGGLVFHFKGLQYRHVDSPGSVRLWGDNGTLFTLYDRTKSSVFFEQHELPDAARRAGYTFAYMAECRDEGFFCDVVGSVPSSVDIVVCDSDGELYRTDQLDPGTIVL